MDIHERFVLTLYVRQEIETIGTLCVKRVTTNYRKSRLYFCLSFRRSVRGAPATGRVHNPGFRSSVPLNLIQEFFGELYHDTTSVRVLKCRPACTRLWGARYRSVPVPSVVHPRKERTFPAPLTCDLGWQPTLPVSEDRVQRPTVRVRGRR